MKTLKIATAIALLAALVACKKEDAPTPAAAPAAPAAAAPIADPAAVATEAPAQ